MGSSAPDRPGELRRLNAPCADRRYGLPVRTITTERLSLRDWQESDLAPWAAMNADPRVREHLGPLLTVDQATAAVENFKDSWERNGYGFWAIEVKATGEFIGFTGLDNVDPGLPFTGVEVGWRLTRGSWGRGYATEAALAALDFGFDHLELSEILAVATLTNLRSQAVMRRVGMTTDPAENFDDPDQLDGPLRRNVLYRKRRGIA